jgi:hypothetical protein
MATKRVMGREVAGKHGVVLADDLNASLGNIDKQISADLADKLDNAVSATDRLLGRDTAGAGAVEELTVGGGIEFTGSGGIQSAAFTGDVTKAAGGTALTIASDAVTYAKMQNVSATQRVLGRNTSGSGDVEEVTFTQFLDWVGSAAEGDILYRGASAWSRLAKGTAGQLLRMNSGATAPEWTSVGSVAPATNTANFDKTNTTLADVTGMSVPLDPGTWRVVIDGNGTNSSGNPGFIYRVGGTVTATLEGSWFIVSEAAASYFQERETAIGSGGISLATTVTAHRMSFVATLVVTVAGTLTLQFARSGASGTARFLANGNMLATRIA